MDELKVFNTMTVSTKYVDIVLKAHNGLAGWLSWQKQAEFDMPIGASIRSIKFCQF